MTLKVFKNMEMTSIGAMAFSIMTFSKMAFSIKGLFVTYGMNGT